MKSDTKKICAARQVEQVERASRPPSVMRQTRHNSGIATFSAVVMLTIVMIAVTSLTHYFAQQARYTRDEVADAQLRQMLLAGEQWTRGNVSRFTEAIRHNPKEDVPLPRTLREAGASLRVERMSSRDGPTMTSANRNLNVRVTASLGNRQMSQVVGYWYDSAYNKRLLNAVNIPDTINSTTDARLQGGRKISPASR